jgi:hypothetical protein
MKIGIRIGNWSPEEGGRFTFQDEILKAFIQYSCGSNHQFIIIGLQKTPPIDIDSFSNLEYASLYWSGKHHRRIFEKLKFWLEKFVAKLDQSYRMSTKNPYFEEIAKDYQVDLMWFLSASYPPQDIPYVTTVWDLQHRLQPFFPEVSANGVWESREQSLRELLQRAAYIPGLPQPCGS